MALVILSTVTFTRLIIMSSLITLLAVSSLACSTPSIQDGSTVFSNKTNVNVNDVTESYVENNKSIENNDKSVQSAIKRSGSPSLGEDITSVTSYLAAKYPTYYWIKNSSESHYTNEVTGSIPIEMQSTDFPKSDVLTAVSSSGADHYTNYGGCGPIAIMGIMDYFNRYFAGFNEYLPSPYTSSGRVELAVKVLENIDWVRIFTLDHNQTFVNPEDSAAAFNSVAAYYGISDMLSASGFFNLHSYDENYYWNTITRNIKLGMPVTMATGLFSGQGSFSQHYTNIFGYETWVGIDDSTGERITKKFIKARLNWGETSAEHYCESSILKCPQLGLITYNLNYRQQYSFTAQNFSTFVNNSNQGQYFFNNVSQEIELPNNIYINTFRLRTSFIENKYLVMSPNRINAGTAFLHLAFNHRVQKMTFSAALWSQLEGVNYQTFKIEYDDPDTGWKTLKTINLQMLSTNRNNPDLFVVYLPRQTLDIRFYTTHSNPTSTRNKGRICLDNFLIEYF